ncbi:hypothetical protein, partial [Actinomadura harenae]
DDWLVHDTAREARAELQAWLDQTYTQFSSPLAALLRSKGRDGELVMSWTGGPVPQIGAPPYHVAKVCCLYEVRPGEEANHAGMRFFTLWKGKTRGLPPGEGIKMW